MADIERNVDRAADLTIRTVRGDVTAQELLDEIAAYVVAGPPTLFSLWDLTGANVDLLTSEDVRTIAQASVASFALRQGGRTAIVLSTPAGFGIGRMYGQLCDVRSGLVLNGTFQDRTEALAWLGAA